MKREVKREVKRVVKRVSFYNLAAAAVVLIAMAGQAGVDKHRHRRRERHCRQCVRGDQLPIAGADLQAFGGDGHPYAVAAKVAADVRAGEGEVLELQAAGVAAGVERGHRAPETGWGCPAAGPLRRNPVDRELPAARRAGRCGRHRTPTVARRPCSRGPGRG